MNKELSEVLKIYSTKPHNEFTTRLINSSKETVVSLFTDILTMYINDKNSSTIREYITVIMSGYNHSENKIGFNGFKQNSIIGGKPIACEAKPKNFNTEDLVSYQNGTRKTKPSKLNGAGNFSDYTFARLKKDTEENPHMLTSGFVDGKLLYILEFPFNTKSFTDKLKIQLIKNFPDGEDKSGHFLRSANFDFRDYIDSQEVKKVYILPKSELENYSEFITGKFYEKLLSF